MAKAKKKKAQKGKGILEPDVMVYIYSLAAIAVSLIGCLQIGFAGSLLTSLLQYLCGTLYGVVYAVVIVTAFLAMMRKSWKQLPAQYLVAAALFVTAWMILASIPSDETLKGAALLRAHGVMLGRIHVVDRRPTRVDALVERRGFAALAPCVGLIQIAVGRDGGAPLVHKLHRQAGGRFQKHAHFPGVLGALPLAAVHVPGQAHRQQLRPVLPGQGGQPLHQALPVVLVNHGEGGSQQLSPIADGHAGAGLAQINT